MHPRMTVCILVDKHGDEHGYPRQSSPPFSALLKAGKVTCSLPASAISASAIVFIHYQLQ